MNDNYDHLLESEREGVLLVNRIGVDRANELIEKIGNHVKKRALKFNSERVYFDFAFTEIGVAHNRELEVMHKLKIGVGLVCDYFTPYASKQRILKRIEKRNAERLVKSQR